MAKINLFRVDTRLVHGQMVTKWRKVRGLDKIVIVDDNLLKLPLAVKIAHKTMRIVKTNIVFALGVKAIVLVLGALGIASMWLAVFADVGVAIIAILNAMRALSTKNLK